MQEQDVGECQSLEQIGLKHYLAPLEAYVKGNLPPTPFREEQPRLDVPRVRRCRKDRFVTLPLSIHQGLDIFVQALTRTAGHLITSKTRVRPFACLLLRF